MLINVTPVLNNLPAQVPLEMAPIPRNDHDENSGNYKHHCGLCNGAPSTRCFKLSHVAYCEACGCIFTVRSSKSGGGCISHPYALGYNMSYKKIKSKMPPENRNEFELQLEAEVRRQTEADADEKERVAAENEAAKKKQQVTAKERKKLRLMQKVNRIKN
jgi:hypothetical protein